MIDRIKGKLVLKDITKIVVDINGIGFGISVPLSTFEKLPAVGESISLSTYLHVREDILDLYGFKTTHDRDLFVTLIKVNGVGPKMALAILSRFDMNSLSQVVADGDVKRLSTVSGIGKKTAERLLIELRNRLKVEPSGDIVGTVTEISVAGEAIRALEVLGFSTSQADQSIRSASKKLGEKAEVEDLVKFALKKG